jgi:hypothetical protein
VLSAYLKKKEKKTYKPGSVVGNHLSKRPTRRNEKRTASFFSQCEKNSFLCGLAPDRVCLPLLLPKARWALTPPFHHSLRHLAPQGASWRGGLFSVALSVDRFRPPTFDTWYPVLRCPDFPPRCNKCPGAIAQSSFPKNTFKILFGAI